MTDFYLAQINIAKAKEAIDSPTMKGFVDQIDKINVLAEQAEGFIWRLQGYDGDATSINAFDDPNLIINMSVWVDIESLKTYVYKTAHVELIRDRAEWFSKIDKVQQALWWIPKGDIPSIEEGKSKLALLEKNGPSQNAFTFSNSKEKPSA